MNLIHVYDGRTEENEYYWFVLLEVDDSHILMLTMSEEKISSAISDKFLTIQQSFDAVMDSDNLSEPDVVLKEMQTQLNFESRVTSRR